MIQVLKGSGGIVRIEMASFLVKLAIKVVQHRSPLDHGEGESMRPEKKHLGMDVTQFRMERRRKVQIGIGTNIMTSNMIESTRGRTRRAATRS